MISFLAFLFVFTGAGIYLAVLYNGLIALKNDIEKSWANIDVLLKQRHDELPRLVDVCKGYMQYEQETLARVVQARAAYAQAAFVGQKLEASRDLSSSVQHLFATAENYPALQANSTFLQLQKRISDLENQIADRREFYNDAVNIFNTRIQQMPDALLAAILHLQPHPMFLVSASEKAPPRVAPGATRL